LKNIYIDAQTQKFINDAIAASLKVIIDTVQGPRWDEITCPRINHSKVSQLQTLMLQGIFFHQNLKTEAVQ
jgi:hypothetical protein